MEQSLLSFGCAIRKGRSAERGEETSNRDGICTPTMSNGKIEAIFDVLGQRASHPLFIYTCARARHALILLHGLFVLLLCARLLLPLSSSSSFFLISRGADSNDQAERTRTELYMTRTWHALIVRTCQKKKRCTRKSNERQGEREKTMNFFFWCSPSPAALERAVCEQMVNDLFPLVRTKTSETNGQ